MNFWLFADLNLAWCLNRYWVPLTYAFVPSRTAFCSTSRTSASKVWLLYNQRALLNHILYEELSIRDLSLLPWCDGRCLMSSSDLKKVCFALNSPSQWVFLHEERVVCLFDFLLVLVDLFLAQSVQSWGLMHFVYAGSVEEVSHLLLWSTEGGLCVVILFPLTQLMKAPLALLSSRVLCCRDLFPWGNFYLHFRCLTLSFNYFFFLKCKRWGRLSCSFLLSQSWKVKLLFVVYDYICSLLLLVVLIIEWSNAYRRLERF